MYIPSTFPITEVTGTPAAYNIIHQQIHVHTNYLTGHTKTLHTYPQATTSPVGP